MSTSYRFSLGPWNIHPGADPFGPPVRPPVSFDDVLGAAIDLGFAAVQFHDDDVKSELDGGGPEMMRKSKEAKTHQKRSRNQAKNKAETKQKNMMISMLLNFDGTDSGADADDDD